MKEYYEILGVSPDVSTEEVELAYANLKEKYSRERFCEGEVGNFAAKQLTKIETAYHEIMLSRKEKQSEDGSFSFDYNEIESLIKKGDIATAQIKLDDVTDRNGEWHYLQSVIFYKKNWMNESKKQLEIALSIEPHNAKYSDDYSKLKQKMEYNERQFKSGNMNNAYNENDATNRQMGGSGLDSCMSFCATWCCINTMCNICC